MRVIKKNPLFFAFLLPAVVDFSLTLIGQEKAFYSGLIRPNEASPAYYFLLISPWLFVFGSILWFIFWYWFFQKVSEGWKLWFSLLFICGHSWGTSSWLMKILPCNVNIKWLIVIVYLGIVASGATYCIREHFRGHR